MELRLVPVDSLPARCSPAGDRRPTPALEASIATVGVQQPLDVRADGGGDAAR